jgi:hypothetical protein
MACAIVLYHVLLNLHLHHLGQAWGKNPSLMSCFIAGVGVKSFSKRVAAPNPVIETR